MSKNEILYVRGMNMSASEEGEDDNEDIWDDTKLNEAYDKALKMANAEVAKRVAMSTNTLPECESNKHTGHKVNTVKLSQKKDKIQWKAGMPCRAVYEGDGQEYEAYLLRIINDKECVVRFLGYENSEIVLLSSLKQTLGKNERTKQLEDILIDKTDDGGSSGTFHVEEHSLCSRTPSVDSSDVFTRKKKSGKKKKPKQRQLNGFDNLPQMSMPIPNFAQLRNLDMDMPIPPPPPLSLRRGEADCEEQAVSSMLLSWYMSGYYTGLYQGMKRAKEMRHN